ncbi:hypothetical protein FACS1894156_9100 [Bacteroidia bacterium]|nr:hypothetical protein FACS1894156_9100 [Bacteroidia bacterium]
MNGNSSKGHSNPCGGGGGGDKTYRKQKNKSGVGVFHSFMLHLVQCGKMTLAELQSMVMGGDSSCGAASGGGASVEGLMPSRAGPDAVVSVSIAEPLHNTTLLRRVILCGAMILMLVACGGNNNNTDMANACEKEKIEVVDFEKEFAVRMDSLRKTTIYAGVYKSGDLNNFGNDTLKTLPYLARKYLEYDTDPKYIEEDHLVIRNGDRVLDLRDNLIPAATAALVACKTQNDM